MDTNQPIRRARVPAYAPQFKAQVLAECAQPGASVAKVALAHRLNANMVHAWRRQAQDPKTQVEAGTEFIPLRLDAPPVAAACTPIRIELRHGETTVAVAWPVEAAASCATWLRGLLR